MVTVGMKMICNSYNLIYVTEKQIFSLLNKVNT